MKNSTSVDYYMSFALDQAKIALACDEVPIGAVVVKDNEIIGSGYNQVICQNSVTAHAEMNAIIDASLSINSYRLSKCDLYVTVEPCYMCCMAIVHARISNIYFATKQPKMGAVVSVDNFFDRPSHNHQVTYSLGGQGKESTKLMQDFFKARR